MKSLLNDYLRLTDRYPEFVWTLRLQSLLDSPSVMLTAELGSTSRFASRLFTVSEYLTAKFDIVEYYAKELREALVKV